MVRASSSAWFCSSIPPQEGSSRRESIIGAKNFLDFRTRFFLSDFDCREFHHILGACLHSVGRDDSARRFGAFRRGVSPPAGGDLLFPWRKRRQNATGDASDGLRLRFAPPRPIGRFPRTPLRGTPSWKLVRHFRRAKSEWHPKFLPGHWALGLQNLKSLRFKNSAWLCRVNASVSVSAVGAHIVRPLSLPLGGKVPQCAHWGG